MSDVQVIRKNTTGQYIYFDAFNEITGEDVTGDAANMTTKKISLDNAASGSLTNNVAELDSDDQDGVYYIELTQSESNCDAGNIRIESTTANVKVTRARFNTVPNFEDGSMDVDWNTLTITPSSGSGITVTSGSSGSPAVIFTGHTSGAGLELAGGTSGDGLTVIGGVTAGNGITISANSGDGIDITPGTNQHGIYSRGNGTGSGLKLEAGTSGSGLESAGSSGGAAIKLTGNSGNGLEITASANTHCISLSAGPVGSAGISYSSNTPGETDLLLMINATVDTAISDYLGTDGDGLTAVPWNSSWDAEVESEVTDSLVAHNLDHLSLTPVASNADMTTEVPDGTILSNIMTKTGDTSDFVSTTDSLEGIANATTSGTLGAGAISWTYTVTNSATGLGLADVDVWVTSDTAGLNILASGRTNQNGQVTFNLDAGTVYVWKNKSGWNDDQGTYDTETVS